MTERPEQRGLGISGPFALFDAAADTSVAALRRPMLAARAQRMLWGQDYAQPPQQLEAELNDYGRPTLGYEIAATMQVFVPTVDSQGRRARILDDAAGVGIVSGALHNEGYAVTAADLDATGTYLNYIETKYPGIKTIRRDMNAPADPDESGTFNGITTAMSNRYIQKPENYLETQLERLTDGGVLLWAIHDAESAPWKKFSGNRAQKTTSDELRGVALDVGYTSAVSFDGQPIPPFDVFPFLVQAHYLALVK